MGSVIGISGALLYSGPASSTARTNLTIFRSRDGGRSWRSDPQPLHEGPSGYSDLAMLSPHLAAVLYENGQKGHTNSFAEKVTLRTFAARP